LLHGNVQTQDRSTPLLTSPVACCHGA